MQDPSPPPAISVERQELRDQLRQTIQDARAAQAEAEQRGTANAPAAPDCVQDLERSSTDR